MANPQLENGYTRIANEVLEALANAKLNGTQFRIVLAVIRCTYGYNKKEHEMSDTFISEATGINVRQIKRELKKLVENNILIITDEGTYTEAKKIMINKHYNTWKLDVVVAKKTPINSEGGGNSDATEKGKEPSPAPLEIGGGNDLETGGDKINPTAEPDNTIKDLGEMANVIGSVYTSLTKSPVFMGQDMIIFRFLQELDEKNRDAEFIKGIMELTHGNWKPKYAGDQIRSFKYFIPAIKEAIAFKEAKENDGGTKGDTKRGESKPNPAGGEREYKPSSGFKKFQLRDD